MASTENHRVLDKQYGGAHAQLGNGYNGGGPCSDTEVTPVNSVVLLRP